MTENQNTIAIAGFDSLTSNGAEMNRRNTKSRIKIIQYLNHGYNVETFVKVHLSIGEKPFKNDLRVNHGSKEPGWVIT